MVKPHHEVQTQLINNLLFHCWKPILFISPVYSNHLLRTNSWHLVWMSHVPSTAALPTRNASVAGLKPFLHQMALFVQQIRIIYCSTNSRVMQFQPDHGYDGTATLLSEQREGIFTGQSPASGRVHPWIKPRGRKINSQSQVPAPLGRTTARRRPMHKLEAQAVTPDSRWVGISWLFSLGVSGEFLSRPKTNISPRTTCQLLLLTSWYMEHDRLAHVSSANGSIFLRSTY